jgi:hypothetical protein
MTFRWVCKVTVLDRDDWMYKASRLDLSFLKNVRKKFLPFAQKLRNWRNNDLEMNDYKLPDIFK